MTGGSQQQRLYRRARRDGIDREIAARDAGIPLGEAKLIDAEDAKYPPPPEAYELLSNPAPHIAEAPAEQEDPMSEPEILSPQQAQSQRAVDGALVPGPALTGGQLIDQIGDGELSHELHMASVDLAAAMNEIHHATHGNKVKGSMTLKIEFERDGDSFKVAYDLKTKKPSLPKPRTTLFCDEHNRFSRFPTGQGQFFGIRNAGGPSGGIRSV